MAGHYTDEQCIDALKKAEEKLGHSPSRREYRKLDIQPDESTIRRRFNGWNSAKKRAGLKQVKAAERIENEVQEKPEEVELPEGIDWKNDLNARQRWYHKNKEDEIESSRKRREEIKEWYRKTKKSEKCKNCGEDRKETLVYHHDDPEQKEMTVHEMVRKSYSIEKIKEEMEKCTVLCSNCHRMLHANGELV